LALFGVAGVAAADDALRIDPPSQSVSKGGTAAVKVIQRASVPTSGAQATVTFDPAIVQVVSLAWGTPHEPAAIFVPSDMKPAIAAANKAGKLQTIATAFIPPASVPAGDADFLVIGFKAVGCGTSELGLPVGPLDAVLLDGRPDTYGAGLPVTTRGGAVDVPCDGTTGAPAPGNASGGNGGSPWMPLGLAAGVAAALAGGLVLLQRSRSRR
jgi:hypothetical protein